MLTYEFEWSSDELNSLSERARGLAYTGWPAALARLVPALIIVVGGALGAWLGASRTVGLDTALVGYSAIGAVMGLIVSSYASHALSRWLNRFSSLPSWKGQVVWELGEDALTLRREGLSATCAWDQIDAVVIDDGDIFIVITSVVHILPDRAFDAPSDRQAAYEFIWERLSSTAQALSGRLQASDEFLDFDS